MCRPLHRIQADAALVHLPQRAHLAQLADALAQQLHRVVHVLLGGEAPEGEADRAVGELVVAHEGASEAEVHAEPDDTASSLMPMISDSPSTKLKLTLRLCGTRCSRSPFTY